DIKSSGNWERKNILWKRKKEEIFSRERNISPEDLQRIIQKGKKLLLEKRNLRIRPQTDDKVLLGWNALMNTALSMAFASTGDKSFRKLATDNMQFLLSRFSANNTAEYFHSWKNDIGKQPAFLDDYSFLIQALIKLQEVTGNTDYLGQAKKLTEHVLDNFSDPTTDFFFYTNKHQNDVVVRKKEVYDGAQPSGNAIMADNLHRLGIYFDKPGWREKSIRLIQSLGNAIIRYPTTFGAWACLMQEIIAGTSEIAIISDTGDTRSQVLKEYIPHKIIMSGSEGSNSFPLLSGKEKSYEAKIYLCRAYVCEKPVSSVSALMAIIRRK
ncbi:MAG TPA: hypothetical protein VJ765_11705, partial [Chitinophagaceae bacterium]|nr:hypothetical protein [Chitinophagaceae bacterium]